MVVVHELLATWETRLYRIVRSDQREDPVLVNSLKSHYELGLHPRGPIRPAVLHMGLSTYREPEQAQDTARAWPVIGGYVAELVLTSGNGFNMAETGHPGHVTVWGDPLKLSEAVVDIVEVQR